MRFKNFDPIITGNKKKTTSIIEQILSTQIEKVFNHNNEATFIVDCGSRDDIETCSCKCCTIEIARFRAAFEAVSQLKLQPVHSKLSIIDLREIELAWERPSISDGFDPRDHRNPKVVIKPWMAYVNLLRASVGLGMLGAPLAMSQAGFLFGPIMTLSIGLLLIHTHLMLLWCLHEICRQLKTPYISYRYGFRLALLHGPPLLHYLGHWGPFIIALFMLMSQIGICSVIIIFISDNIRDIMDWRAASSGLVCIIIPILVLEILMKNLSTISYVINGANLMNLFALILVIIQMFRGPRREAQLFSLGWVSLLMAVGTFMFNLSAVGVILSCEKALAKPHIMTAQFGPVQVGLIVPTLVCIVIGLLGFWSFGVMDENVLRYLPYDDPITMVAFGVYSISALLSYPLACYPGVQIILEVIKNHDPYVEISPESLKQTAVFVRPIFVCISFIIAYYLPFQGPFVAFVGSFCTTLMSLVFPALMEIGLCYPNHYGRFNFILMKDLLIVTLGLVVWFGGILLCGYLLYLRILFTHSPIGAFEIETIIDLDVATKKFLPYGQVKN